MKNGTSDISTFPQDVTFSPLPAYAISQKAYKEKMEGC